MRRDCFAVSTPRSINLQKDLLITLQNCWFEVISDNRPHCTCLISRNRGWLQESFSLSRFYLSNKSCKFFSWEVWSVPNIFFSGINKINKSRSVVNFNAEIFSKSTEMIFILLLVYSGEDMIFIASRGLNKLSRSSWIRRTCEQNQSIFFIFKDCVDCLLTKSEVLRVNLNEENDEEKSYKPHRYRLFIL